MIIWIFTLGSSSEVHRNVIVESTIYILPLYQLGTWRERSFMVSQYLLYYYKYTVKNWVISPGA